MDRPPKSPASKIEREKLKIECASWTKANERHPKRNEDSILEDTEHGVFAILDGHGDETVSQIARDYIKSRLSEIPDGMEIHLAEIAFSKIIEEANRIIYEKFKNQVVDNAESTGNGDVGTTISIIKIYPDNNGEVWMMRSNVGDSRIYKIKKDSEIDQLTTDDDMISLASELTLEEKYLIRKKLNEARYLSELDDREIKYFNQRNTMVSCLGQKNISVSVISVPLIKGDRYLMTSDGMPTNLTTNNIKDKIKESKTNADAVVSLVEEAAEVGRQGKIENMRAQRDDMSVLIVEAK